MAQCPYCGHKHELATGVTGEKEPGDGDVSFCISCGRFSMFDSTRAENLRVLTPAENHEIRTDNNCRRIYTAWFLTKPSRRT
jgi:hypothetical protein